MQNTNSTKLRKGNVCFLYKLYNFFLLVDITKSFTLTFSVEKFWFMVSVSGLLWILTNEQILHTLPTSFLKGKLLPLNTALKLIWKIKRKIWGEKLSTRTWSSKFSSCGICWMATVDLATHIGVEKSGPLYTHLSHQIWIIRINFMELYTHLQLHISVQAWSFLGSALTHFTFSLYTDARDGQWPLNPTPSIKPTYQMRIARHRNAVKTRENTWSTSVNPF